LKRGKSVITPPPRKGASRDAEEKEPFGSPDGERGSSVGEIRGTTLTSRMKTTDKKTKASRSCGRLSYGNGKVYQQLRKVKDTEE